MNAIQEHKSGVLLTLHVKPNSKKSVFPAEVNDSEIVIKVKSPADKGKANKEIIKVLQSFFKGVASHVEIISGMTSKNKHVLLYDANISDVRSRLGL